MPHHHHSREEQAKIEIGHTESTRGINLFLTAFLFVVLFSVPLAQAFFETRAALTEKTATRNSAFFFPGSALPQFCDVFQFLLPKPAEIGGLFKAESLGAAFSAARDINNRILRDINRYESELKDRDLFVQWVVPPTRTVIAGFLRGGNEDAYCGRDGWLFYRRDIDYLVGRGFLDKNALAARAMSGNELKSPVRPDPLPAIADFRDQLARRGIELLLVPAPVKPAIYPEKFSGAYSDRTSPLENASYKVFLEKACRFGLRVYDPADLLMAAKLKDDKAVYLATDTHWTPEGMALVAEALAARVEKILGKAKDSGRAELSASPAEVTNAGDIAMMLKLARGEKFYKPQTVSIRRIFSGNGVWRPDRSAEILLLGDSFTNIFSLGRMGWGASAGLAEQLSFLTRRPIDTILRNDAGSYATREMLAGELKKGRDRLAGKKLVIWEFAARELACGDWKIVDMTPSAPRKAEFLALKPGQILTTSATAVEVAPAPRPGTVPYKDHVIAMSLDDLSAPEAANRQVLVYALSMRDNAWTAAAGVRPGDRVKIRLSCWGDVENEFGGINRAEIENEAVALEEPCWGEIVNEK